MKRREFLRFVPILTATAVAARIAGGQGDGAGAASAPGPTSPGHHPPPPGPPSRPGTRPGLPRPPDPPPPQATVTFVAASMNAGALIAVSLSGGAGNAQDWLTIARVADAPEVFGVWTYAPTASFSWRPDLPAIGGQYEVRYFLNNSHVIAARSAPFTVIAPDQAGQGAINQRTGIFYPGNSGPSQAMMAAQTGDTVLVNPATYSNFAITLPRTITVKSAVAGQKYTFDVGGAPNRCIELAYGVGGTFEDFEICNNKTEWGNAAGFWPTGGPYALTLRRGLLHDLSNGILIGDHREATVLIEDTEAYDCGDYNGFGHNFYIGPVKSLIVRGCWSHMVKNRGDTGVPNWAISWGHLLKSRAQVTLIEASRLTQEHGESNRCIDLPNGGDATIRSCLLELSANNPNNQGYGQALSYGVEETLNQIGLTVHNLRFQQNTVVNHGDVAKKQWLYLANTMPTEYSNVDNVYAGFNSYVQGDQAYVPSATANSLVPLAAMPGHGAMDFALTTPVAGSRNWAARAYRHPSSSVPRTDSFRGAVPPAAWNVPAIGLGQGAGSTFDLASTLPPDIARGGVFAVDASGSTLPAGVSLSSTGILSASSQITVSVSGVIFSYAL